MTTVPAIPDQAHSLPQVTSVCEAVESWVQTADDVGMIEQAVGRLGAMAEYLRLTSQEGRGRIELTARKCAARVGELTPERPRGRGAIDFGSESMTPKQRSDFRKIAEHADLIDKVGSTDARPLTHNRLMEKIREEESLQRDIERLTPDDFDPRANRELIRQRGALVRLCDDINRLGDPVDFALRNNGHLGLRHYETARRAAEWLQSFVNTEDN
jgi:hypothetical protein